VSSAWKISFVIASSLLPMKLEERLGKKQYVNVPSFSRKEEMPLVGRNHHMA
jgi:hypothetical protein